MRQFEAISKGTKVKEKLPEKHCKKNIWLVKPANENQGKGIKIFDKLEDISRFIETSLQFSHWVIQKYIERPLLYKNRKFDIRVWAFAHSALDFYFYDIGYIRTSSAEYTTEEMKYSDLSHKDKHLEQDYTYEAGCLELAHLTNNCL